MYHYEYLNDTEFLQELTKSKIKQQYVKIIVLDWKGNTIEQITGRALGGSINVDGTSAMRRTASIQLIADDTINKLTNIDNLISLNKKVKIAIGIKNITNKYLEYPIFWFPQGQFVIVEASIEHSSDGTEINLTLHDKIALLNGECGGIIPAPVNFSEMEDQDEFGNTLITNPTIASIIKELMVHFGNEQEKNLVINDLDGPVRQVVRWCGENELPLNYFFVDAQKMAGRNEKAYNNLKILNTEINPTVQEDEFYEQLLQKLIWQAFKKTPQYDENLYPNSATVVKYFVETPTTKSVQELKNIIEHLEKISKNSESLLTNLTNEKNTLQSALSTIESQITTTPTEFRQALDNLCGKTIPNFYTMKWYNAYANGFWYPDSTDKNRQFRDPISKRLVKIKWLKPEHRNKKDIDTLINKLKTLKQRVSYVKSKIGTFIPENWAGTYDEWKKGAPQKRKNNYYIFGRMVFSYLLDFSFPIDKKYYTKINYNVKDFKSYIKNNSPYYFYNKEKNIGVFIRGNNVNAGNGKRISFGTIDYNAAKRTKNITATILKTTNQEIKKSADWKEASKKAKPGTSFISWDDNGAWWLSQIIFADRIKSIKKDAKNNDQLIEQINELCSYRVLKQLKACLNYMQSDYFENNLTDKLSVVCKRPSMLTSDAEAFCDNIISFVDNMLTYIEDLKEDYNYNIKTYTYMRTKALNDKIFNDFNKELDENKKIKKVTFSERVDQELTNLKKLADKLSRNFDKSLAFPYFVYDSNNKLTGYYTYSIKNLRDIGKYIVNNSGIFSELQGKNIDKKKTRIHIKTNNICSISQISQKIVTQLKNYNFQTNNMTWEQIMNDIIHIICYYVSSQTFYPSKINSKWSVTAMYYKYYRPILVEAEKAQSETAKKERKQLESQKRIITKRLEQITKDEQTIPTACNNVLKQWCKKELPTYTKIIEKLTIKTNNQNRLQALQQQTKMLQSYYNNGKNLANNTKIITQHLTAIGKANNYDNLVQSSLKLDPNISQTIQKFQLQGMSHIDKYVQYNKQMTAATKEYKKDLQQLTKDLNEKLVQISINEKEATRLENEIASAEKQEAKSSNPNAKASISELNNEISSRKQDLNDLLTKLKKEKIQILKNFFKNKKTKDFDAYEHFFTAFGKAAYARDLTKDKSKRKWYSALKVDSVDKLTINNLYVIYNTLFNDPAIKSGTKKITYTQAPIHRNYFWNRIFYRERCLPAYIYGVKQFLYGEDVGYTLTDFVYPGELSCAAGETITSVLDKIKKALGNYEYYYDIDGKFVFQEVRNYLNTSYSTSLSRQISNSNNFTFNYTTNSPVAYDFSDGEIIQSYQNTPKYQQIKNDFIIWGQRETVAGQKVPIRYHLAIDSPPSINGSYFLDAPKDRLEVYQYKVDMPTRPSKKGNKYKVVYIQEENTCYEWVEADGYTGYKKIDYFINNNNVIKEFGNFPFNTNKKGKNHQFYLNQDTGLLYEYNSKNKKYERRYTYRFQMCEGSKPTQGKIGKYYYSNNKEKIYVCSGPKNTDFQELTNVNSLKTINCIGTAFFLEGYLSEINETTANNYYSELKTEWPKIWDLLKNKYFADIEQKKLTSLDYFLNLINSTDLISKFNISAIGKRSHIISNNSINCIFQPTCPEIIFFDNNPPVEENQTFSKQSLQRKDYEKKTKEQKRKDLLLYNNINSSNYIERFVDHSIFQYLKLGGTTRSAYEEIRSQLYQFITYNEQVSISILPIHYLQPNIIIKLKNKQTGINGNFLIQSFSIPLDINSNMLLNCTKAISRI